MWVKDGYRRTYEEREGVLGEDVWEVVGGLRDGALLAPRCGSTVLRLRLLGHANLVRCDFVNGPSDMHSRRFATATVRQVRYPRLR